jgi:hypothetical protein
MSYVLAAYSDLAGAVASHPALIAISSCVAGIVAMLSAGRKS